MGRMPCAGTPPPRGGFGELVARKLKWTPPPPPPASPPASPPRPSPPPGPSHGADGPRAVLGTSPFQARSHNSPPPPKHGADGASDASRAHPFQARSCDPPAAPGGALRARAGARSRTQDGPADGLALSFEPAGDPCCCGAPDGTEASGEASTDTLFDISPPGSGTPASGARASPLRAASAERQPASRGRRRDSERAKDKDRTHDSDGKDDTDRKPDGDRTNDGDGNNARDGKDDADRKPDRDRKNARVRYNDTDRKDARDRYDDGDEKDDSARNGKDDRYGKHDGDRKNARDRNADWVRKDDRRLAARVREQASLLERQRAQLGDLAAQLRAQALVGTSLEHQLVREHTARRQLELGHPPDPAAAAAAAKQPAGPEPHRRGRAAETPMLEQAGKGVPAAAAVHQATAGTGSGRSAAAEQSGRRGSAAQVDPLRSDQPAGPGARRQQRHAAAQTQSSGPLRPLPAEASETTVSRLAAEVEALRAAKLDVETAAEHTEHLLRQDILDLKQKHEAVNQKLRREVHRLTHALGEERKLKEEATNLYARARRAAAEEEKASGVARLLSAVEGRVAALEGDRRQQQQREAPAPDGQHGGVATRTASTASDRSRGSSRGASASAAPPESATCAAARLPLNSGEDQRRAAPTASNRSHDRSSHAASASAARLPLSSGEEQSCAASTASNRSHVQSSRAASASAAARESAACAATRRPLNTRKEHSCAASTASNRSRPPLSSGEEQSCAASQADGEEAETGRPAPLDAAEGTCCAFSASGSSSSETRAASTASNESHASSRAASASAAPRESATHAAARLPLSSGEEQSCAASTARNRSHFQSSHAASRLPLNPPEEQCCAAPQADDEDAVGRPVPPLDAAEGKCCAVSASGSSPSETRTASISCEWRGGGQLSGRSASSSSLQEERHALAAELSAVRSRLQAAEQRVLTTDANAPSPPSPLHSAERLVLQEARDRAVVERDETHEKAALNDSWRSGLSREEARQHADQLSAVKSLLLSMRGEPAPALQTAAKQALLLQDDPDRAAAERDEQAGPSNSWRSGLSREEARQHDDQLRAVKSLLLSMWGESAPPLQSAAKQALLLPAGAPPDSVETRALPMEEDRNRAVVERDEAQERGALADSCRSALNREEARQHADQLRAVSSLLLTMRGDPVPTLRAGASPDSVETRALPMEEDRNRAVVERDETQERAALADSCRTALGREGARQHADQLRAVKSLLLSVRGESAPALQTAAKRALLLQDDPDRAAAERGEPHEKAGLGDSWPPGLGREEAGQHDDQLRAVKSLLLSMRGEPAEALPDGAERQAQFMRAASGTLRTVERQALLMEEDRTRAVVERDATHERAALADSCRAGLNREEARQHADQLREARDLLASMQGERAGLQAQLDAGNLAFVRQRPGGDDGGGWPLDDELACLLGRLDDEPPPAADERRRRRRSCGLEGALRSASETVQRQAAVIDRFRAQRTRARSPAFPEAFDAPHCRRPLGSLAANSADRSNEPGMTKIPLQSIGARVSGAWRRC